jgi:uncharacterized membrane protein (DUF4010 family)
MMSDLALSLAIGILMGLERDWSASTERVAGLRTFALIGLLGGVCGALSLELGGLTILAAFLTLSVVLGIAAFRRKGGPGMTTEVAALLAFALGALAARGYQREAAAAAVVSTALLGFKPVLHGWVDRIGRGELEAALKFLLISVAVLPNLPDKGFGPWDALNPYHIWWMVVLIAGISFAGYLAVKALGTKGGLLATGVLGGLVSSTAMTLAMARADKRAPQSWLLHAAVIVVASTIMFPRILLEVAAVNPSLLRRLLPAFIAMAGVGFLGAGLMFWRSKQDGKGESPTFKNPLELGTAVFFGGLLAVVTLASVFLKQKFGESGVYATALTAGLMDVDAITLSLSRLSKDGAIEAETAANGILAAAAANQASKAVLAAAVSSLRLGLTAAAVLAASLGAGLAVLYLL